MPIKLNCNRSVKSNKADILNVNGRQVISNNPDKSIWSYNPDDAAFRQGSDETERKVPHHQLSSIDAFSYSLAPLNEEAVLATRSTTTVMQMMLSETPDSTEKSQKIDETIKNGESNGVTPLEIVEHFATTMGRAKPALTVASTYLIDHEKFTFAYDETAKNNNNEQLERLEPISFLKSRLNNSQQQRNLFTEELRKESFDNFKNNLSSMIKRRYKSEADNTAFSQSSFLSAKSKNTFRSNLKSTRFLESKSSVNKTDEEGGKINDAKMVIYGKHIDHLSAEILTALSNGIKKSVMMSGGGKSETDNGTCVNISEEGDDEDESGDEDEGEGEEDEEEERSEEEEGDAGGCEEKATRIDYEDDRIIIGTNVKNRAGEEGNYDEYFKYWPEERRDEENFVMKICNHFQDNEKSVEEKERRRFKRSKKVDRKNDAEEDEDLKSSRSKTGLKHDPNEGIVSNEYEFEYAEVLSGEFRRVLDNYESLGVSADQHIRQELPSAQFYAAQQKNHNSANVLDMYNILKRMLVKKKYAMHTIRLENFSRRTRIRRNASLQPQQQQQQNQPQQNQQQQQQQQQKTRPVTAGTTMSQVVNTNLNENQATPKLNRPKTVNVVPVKSDPPSNKPKPDETKKTEVKNEVKVASRTPFALFEEECQYEQFRLSPTTIKSQMWPYEMDFDKQQHGKKKPTPGRKNSKCFPCKKLPLVKVELPLEAETMNPLGLSASQRFRTKYNYASSKLENEPKVTHMNQTYNSLRRSVSAKISAPNHTPIRNYLRISMHRNQFTDAENDKDEDDDDDDEDDDQDEVEIGLLRRNLDVNKEEQMRKMSLLPGKTFRSQRTKSISIEHVPPSKILLDTQRSKVTPSAYSQQTQPPVQPTRPVKQSKSAASIDGIKRLAIQHQQEIYSLLAEKARRNNNSNNTSNNMINGQPIDVYLPSSKLKIIPISHNEIKSNKSLISGTVHFSENINTENNNENKATTNANNNKTDLNTTMIYRRANKLMIKNRRPKTAKI